MRTERRPIRALTGLRFFAALHVVFYHYAIGLLPYPLSGVAKNGYVAVGLFFVLSGFVLAYNYADRPMDVRTFWTARFARIYPAYLLAFVLIAPAVCVRLVHTDAGKLLTAGLAGIALLQAWFPAIVNTWNGPGWSLSAEVFFYLLFPFVLPRLSRLSRRRLWIAAASCSLAAILPSIVQYAVIPTDQAEVIVSYMPLFRVAEFLLGVVTGLIYRQTDTGRAVGNVRLLAVSLALTGFAAFSPEWIPSVLRAGLAAPLFAVLVYQLAGRDSPFARVLASRPIYALGDASYSIYILQSPVMAYALVVTEGLGSASPARTPLNWGPFSVYCVVLIVASLSCYRWIEVPARHWIMARWTRVPEQPRIPKLLQAPLPQFGSSPGKSNHACQ